jgi:RimJ/RimL family protein N-acetyltransferase
MELRTERLVMRPLDRDTIRSIYNGKVDGPALGGLNVPNDWPMNDLREALPVMFNDLTDVPASIGWHAWVIADAASLMVIGDAGFKGPPDGKGTVEIGFSILPEHRGLGFAKEAVRALIEHAFSTGMVRTIIAECDGDNLVSKRVLSSSRFENVKTGCGRAYYELKAR